MPKRQRFSQYNTPAAYRSSKRRRTARTLVVPGRTRLSGYYGRFTGPDAEHKFLDTSHGIVTIASAGTLYHPTINAVAQDTSETGRIGRKCCLKSMSFNFTAFLPGAVAIADTSDSLRIICYLDKQNNSSGGATVLDILQTASYLSFLNLENSGRFRILFDKRVTLSATAGNGTSTGEVQRSFSIHRKLNYPIEFSGISGLVATVKSNNIGILAISQDDKVQLGSQARVRFSDN